MFPSKIIILSAFLVVASTAPQQPTSPVPIVSQDSDIQPDGSFKWNYELADGTQQEVTGSVKAGEKPGEVVLAVQGSATWTDPEGNHHELRYAADENGFQPQGADIPVPPEVPAHISRALKWIAEHPSKTEKSQK